MRTPICDFVRAYMGRETARFHMPGHKGVPVLGAEPFDITEVAGADALYEAGGVILESEKNASALFGFGRTLYATEGSSQCVRAMLFLAAMYGRMRGHNGRLVLAARNVHQSFIQACALLDLEVQWLYPETRGAGLCSCPVSPDQTARALDSLGEKPIAVYLTSPDYLGYMQDISGIAAVCQSRGVPLLADNAHGAYLRFLEPSLHPVSLGAFMSCDSAHKTLPVLTGGAYLQLSGPAAEALASQAKQALSLFGSTSPSYLTLQSLDLCNRYLAGGYPQKLAAFIGRVDALKRDLAERGWAVAPSDPLRLVINRGAGYTGKELAQRLRGKNIECEFAGDDHLVLMLTPENREADLGKLEAALGKAPGDGSPPEEALPFYPGKQVLSIREAVFAPHEPVDVADAAGRICGAPVVSCPPAVPIAVSGEEITEESVARLRRYGVERIEVVRE